MALTHVRTSPYYPQSNGKIEAFHKTVKTECIRPRTPLSLEEAQRQLTEYITHYNELRLHSAIDYISPKDKLEGRAEQILQGRDRKLQLSRDQRQRKRQLQRLAQDASPAAV